MGINFLKKLKRKKQFCYSFTTGYDGVDFYITNIDSKAKELKKDGYNLMVDPSNSEIFEKFNELNSYYYIFIKDFSSL